MFLFFQAEIMQKEWKDDFQDDENRVALYWSQLNEEDPFRHVLSQLANTDLRTLYPMQFETQERVRDLSAQLEQQTKLLDYINHFIKYNAATYSSESDIASFLFEVLTNMHTRQAMLRMKGKPLVSLFLTSRTRGHQGKSPKEITSPCSTQFTSLNHLSGGGGESFKATVTEMADIDQSVLDTLDESQMSQSDETQSEGGR